MKRLTLGIAAALFVMLIECGSKVDESASGTLIGKIDESKLGPGKSANITFDLLPGKYALICNISGHYKDVMHTSFEVTDGDGAQAATVGVSLGEWFVRADSRSQPAGAITFDVSNTGVSGHNFVAIKTDLAANALVVE